MVSRKITKNYEKLRKINLFFIKFSSISLIFYLSPFILQGAVAKPENFERAFSYRVNGVYRVYGGIFGYYWMISQKK